MREKLIELLGGDMCKDCYCEDCEYEHDEKSCIEHIKRKMADHLIANGVIISKMETVATDNNVGHKWIPVTERLPEKEMEVIVYTGNILKPSVFCYHFWTADLLSWQSVTHWMPLPEPPKGE